MQDEKRFLENMIDEKGLSNVVNALSEICYEKAQHIRENWACKTLAKLWDKDAATLINAVARLKNK